MEKTKVYVMHSSHLDLYWIGAQADCLTQGAAIIDNALSRAERDSSFYFLIETARFLEYYAAAYPERLPALREAFARGQLEMAASYSDRLENHVDGESLVRNALYGRKIIRDILGMDCDLCCHPDLPGFAEQTPQIYKKSGIRYYLSARGFKQGARFHWEGLDGSSILMYNIPGHYAYYDADVVIEGLGQTKRNIASDVILLGCSAGDMGAAGTFLAKENGEMRVYDIDDFLRLMERRHSAYSFSLANAREVLSGMPPGGMTRLRGEYPSRWGHHGSALNVQFYLLDKQVSRALLDAEKFSTVCDLKGKPVQITFAKHPLTDSSGRDSIGRRYFDLKMTPDSIRGWIEFGWRLQMITQDHNFGGVEGAQTEFDRLVYKRAALRIAQSIIDKSLAILAMDAAKDTVAVFNPMNWRRDEIVNVPQGFVTEDMPYIADDGEGIISPLVRVGDGWQFLAKGVPAFGAKTYRIQPGQAAITHAAQIEDTEYALTVQNAFYRLQIDKRSGHVLSFFDLETGREWMRDGAVLNILALRDDSLGGSERKVEKPLLDASDKHVRSVRVRRLDTLAAQVEIITEVLDVKVYQTLTLRNDRKALAMEISYNWPGTPDVQLKMALLKRTEDSRIIYGVPYGAQEYGKYLETDSLVFGSDEISAELFHRYREVQGFFAVEEAGAFLTVASNQSAYDFVPGGANVLLARDVRNGAEQDYRFTNAGRTHFSFTFTSGKGSWTQSSRLMWEQRHPVYAAVGQAADGRLTCETWLDTRETGVLTVLAPASNGDGVIARLYNPTPDPTPLEFNTTLGIAPSACVNLDETPADEPLERLGGYEIKTILFQKT